MCTEDDDFEDEGSHEDELLDELRRRRETGVTHKIDLEDLPTGNIH